MKIFTIVYNRTSLFSLFSFSVAERNAEIIAMTMPKTNRLVFKYQQQPYLFAVYITLWIKETSILFRSFFERFLMSTFRAIDSPGT